MSLRSTAASAVLLAIVTGAGAVASQISYDATGTVAAPVPSSGRLHEDRTWLAPLPAPLTVTRPFQAPPTRYGQGHRGVDLAARPGSKVTASWDGTVVWAGPVAGRPVVSVRHGSRRMTYEPLASSLQVGERVRAGQVLGTLLSGHSGCPVAACLHWGLRDDTTYADPMLLVSGRLRLLPMGQEDI